VTGATASLRGSARFGIFAAGKFAKRALAQSLAREFGPRGVHVAHVNIDGIIDIPRLHERVANGGAPDGKIDPAAVSPLSLRLRPVPDRADRERRLPKTTGTCTRSRGPPLRRSLISGHM